MVLSCINSFAGAKRKEKDMCKKKMLVISAVCACFIAFAHTAIALPLHLDKLFTDEFHLDECTFSSTGSNLYFVLEPGFQTTFVGEENKELVELTITVLNDTLMVGDVETRVVEEVELHDGELAEVSRNYFAICTETNSVFYFGEDVDIYEEGEIVSHEGSWLAFSNGAEPGLIMPGIVLLGARYYQEVALPVAADRAVIVALDETVETPAGTFDNCIETFETTPLEPFAKETKFYAPEIGLVKDGPLEFTTAGFVVLP
jgi:hypothetical protein